jgi:hypothetical protein
MSGYNKSQQYLYGKWDAAHLTDLRAHLPHFDRMNPGGPT